MADSHACSLNRFPDPDELQRLTEKYGDRNVERTAIFILEQREPHTELHVGIPQTAERIEKILDAVHGEFLDG